MGVIWEAWNAQMTWNMARGWAPVRPPLQGSVGFLGRLPRALPWAGLGRAVGALDLRGNGVFHSSAPKGRSIPAQGKALGRERPPIAAF